MRSTQRAFVAVAFQWNPFFSRFQGFTKGCFKDGVNHWMTSTKSVCFLKHIFCSVPCRSVTTVWVQAGLWRRSLRVSVFLWRNPGKTTLWPWIYVSAGFKKHVRVLRYFDAVFKSLSKEIRSLQVSDLYPDFKTSECFRAKTHLLICGCVMNRPDVSAGRLPVSRVQPERWAAVLSFNVPHTWTTSPLASLQTRLLCFSLYVFLSKVKCSKWPRC